MQYTANTLENHWMPFTANKDFKAEPRLLVKASGVYYESHLGHKVIDASSGLFCSAAGHCRQEIADAVAQQLMVVDYSPHFQIGSPPSFELANRLSRITPEGINHVFFANSGSEAVDTSLKIVMAYHRATGQGHRDKYVSRERAYHGVNIGGVSLSGLMKNRETFGAVMPGVVHMRHTYQPEKGRFQWGQPEHGAELAEDLQRFCALLGGQNIAAVYVEPIAGSTGILVPPKGYLERLREICDANGILLIFDEVICGFGRLGTPFGSQAFGVTPDIMTMAKALTNGAQPMGAVAVKDSLYETVINAAPAEAIEFFHGYTYSGHPAASAAGLATLEIYEKENLFERAAGLADYFRDKVMELREAEVVTDIRGYGLIAGFDLAPSGAPGARGIAVQKQLFKNGLHIKFTGDSGIIAPPLVAEKAHIDEMCAIIKDTLMAL